MAEHEGHVHGPTSGKKLWISLVVTLIFCAGEALAGLASHSLALLSDAGHNLSDALAFPRHKRIFMRRAKAGRAI